MKEAGNTERAMSIVMGNLRGKSLYAGNGNQGKKRRFEMGLQSGGKKGKQTSKKARGNVKTRDRRATIEGRGGFAK